MHVVRSKDITRSGGCQSFSLSLIVRINTNHQAIITVIRALFHQFIGINRHALQTHGLYLLPEVFLLGLKETDNRRTAHDNSFPEKNWTQFLHEKIKELNGDNALARSGMYVFIMIGN